MTQETFQQRVYPWLIACFGEAIAGDQVERRQRFLEEALELVQSVGAPRSEVLKLLDYVYMRPKGELCQEVGGVMTTLAAFCKAHEIDMHLCGDVELARIWTKVEQIRIKQANKPKNSPLPQGQERAIQGLDVDDWHGKTGSAVRSYAQAFFDEDQEVAYQGEPSDELLERVNQLLRQGRDAFLDLQLQLSVAGTETAAYYAGQDAAFAGIVERWQQALADPYPKAGVMNQPLEGLYRQTEALRRKNDVLVAFITNLRDNAAGYMHNGNRLSSEADALLKSIDAP